jgi:hypothetical protein
LFTLEEDVEEEEESVRKGKNPKKIEKVYLKHHDNSPVQARSVSD